MCQPKSNGGRRCRGHYKQSLNLDKISANLEKARTYTGERSEKNKKRMAVKIAANNLPKLQNDASYLEHSIDQAMDKLIEYGQEHGLEEFPELSMETKNVYSKEGIEALLSEDQMAEVMKNSDSMSAFKEANPELYDQLSTPNGTKVKTILPDAKTDEDYEKRYERTVNFYAQDMQRSQDAEHLVGNLMKQIERKHTVDKLVSDHKEVLAKCLPDGDFIPYESPIEGNTRGVRVYESKKAPTAAQVRAWAKKHDDQDYAQKVVSSLKVQTVDSVKVRKKFPEVAEKLTHPKTKIKVSINRPQSKLPRHKKSPAFI